jgi:putative methionine-R-sulfoxide reductase with GAF domain
MSSRYTITDVSSRLLDASPLSSLITDALSLPIESVTEFEISELSSYRIPKLANKNDEKEEEDGMCGIGLEKVPFEILNVLLTLDSSRKREEELIRLKRLRLVLSALKTCVDADWIGVYETTIESEKRFEQLLKLTYLGAPSRAYFPLTESFAKNSNNSTSCLRKECIVIHDVTRATTKTLSKEETIPYYTCDTRVQSEVCAPILTREGKCIGLIDCESWKSENFTNEKINTILQTAKALSELDLFR